MYKKIYYVGIHIKNTFSECFVFVCLKFMKIFFLPPIIHSLFRNFFLYKIKNIMNPMKIENRLGQFEEYDKQKICEMVDKNTVGLEKYVEKEKLIQKIEEGLANIMTVREIEDLAAEIGASMMSVHPDYGVFAGNVIINALHKDTLSTFSEKVELMHKEGKYVSDRLYNVTMKYKQRIDDTIDYKRDFTLNYFGVKTLQRSYLLKNKNLWYERPQDVFMRVALEIHDEEIDDALQTYNLMSKKYFIHATPTLFNSGTKNNQLSSCFLLDIKEDSIEGIFDTVKNCALISKSAGGLGINIHNVRAKGSTIKSTGGRSLGVVPMLKTFEATTKYVNQGGKKRPGAMAVYIEPWHVEIYEFLELRKNVGKDEVRTRDLFLGLWVPDLFMKRVEENKDWSLFSADTAPDLWEKHNEEFVKLYEEYEAKGLAIRTVKAQHLWKTIIETQIETGNPFIIYKDTCNRYSNQKNIGSIKCSNLCAEIVEVTKPDEIAVCNLASIGLPTFIKDNKFDFIKLKEIVKVLVKNLDRVIDRTKYPVEETKKSNMRHRPMGIGVQGLADVFIILRMPFDSEEARLLNKQIFETIYYSALESSTELAERYGTYETYEGSPLSQGLLHFDMYKTTPTDLLDWDILREKIKKHGVRNSLFVAVMPTASTSQILGFNECIEPLTSNIYTRRTLAGDFQVVNSYLIKDLLKLNLWNKEIKNLVVQNDGSIQDIEAIPKEIKYLYRTAWELKMKSILDLAADRTPYVDQSQSLNIFIATPTYSQLTSMHFYGHKKQLKTGMYYLRTKPVMQAIKFTVDKQMVKDTIKKMKRDSCSLEDDGCLSCGA
ncbi:Ribonucleoside-diphosphate reductase large chain [Spraguea lophii 42_110]|uniref:Ribonucleoside-diphosphate reductase n=1 Tax=Spraguea lophii (strain 42_110) TaxID=1358809 RepID=S7XK98_SPRLO|nr:Ribonucleoside-diphosphate reductase large chain [Spraguea lophii 42_110]